MKPAQDIDVLACVGGNELAALHLALHELSGALRAAGGRNCDFQCYATTPEEAADLARQSALAIVSLITEAEDFAEPWPQVAERLRRRHAAWAADNRMVVYLLTVFRHVPDQGDLERGRAQRTRIRRLNLLAAELSREFGLFVVDVDRVLADIGGRTLMTDFRLVGPRAGPVVARTIAETLLTTGLDSFASFEIQEAARAHLAADKLPQIGPLSRSTVLNTNTMLVRSGRRTQNVETVGRKQDQMGLYLRLLSAGRLSALDALRILSSAIAKRGFWYCLSAVTQAAGRIVRTRIRTAQRGPT